MPGFEVFGEAERKEVLDVLETGVLFRYGFDGARKGRWKAKEFETELAGRLGVGYCHLCASGTAALSTALAACGIGAGDEVIVPPFTFVATIETILYAGAVPVFADIDETLCLDPAAVASAVTPKTKGVVVVHMCGAMARIGELKDLCERKGLALIEDACQALGGTFRGKPLGTFGRIGCFSFDPVKIVTCGEGGAIVTDDEELYATAHSFADHGHDHVGSDRGKEAHPILGMNFRISELNAAVGLAQLRKLDRMVETQRAHKKILKEAVERFAELRRIPDESGDSATFLTFFLPDEKRAREAAAALGREGVDGAFYWYDNNWHYLRKWDHFKELKAPAKLPLQLLDPVPDFTKVSLEQSDRILARAISLQIKLSWTESDLARRVEKLEKVLSEFGS